MRKDNKSQYQLKKEKLLKIKQILQDTQECIEMDQENEIDLYKVCNRIWEIVKNEKNNY